MSGQVHLSSEGRLDRNSLLHALLSDGLKPLPIVVRAVICLIGYLAICLRRLYSQIEKEKSIKAAMSQYSRTRTTWDQSYSSPIHR